jgi:hypothetical protein
LKSGHTVYNLNMTYFKDILDNSVSVGLGLWCLAQLSTIFQLIYHILAVNFIGEGNRSSRRKTTDHPQKADKLLSHYVVSSTPRHERDSNSQL